MRYYKITTLPELILVPELIVPVLIVPVLTVPEKAVPRLFVPKLLCVPPLIKIEVFT